MLQTVAAFREGAPEGTNQALGKGASEVGSVRPQAPWSWAEAQHITEIIGAKMAVEEKEGSRSPCTEIF